MAPFANNTYASRRGNHEVMMRGTFANVPTIYEAAIASAILTKQAPDRARFRRLR